VLPRPSPRAAVLGIAGDAADGLNEELSHQSQESRICRKHRIARSEKTLVQNEAACQVESNHPEDQGRPPRALAKREVESPSALWPADTRSSRSVAGRPLGGRGCTVAWSDFWGVRGNVSRCKGLKWEAPQRASTGREQLLERTCAQKVARSRTSRPEAFGTGLPGFDERGKDPGEGAKFS
jgi:hypothetical protein